jgi:hypothetical protein
MSECTAAHDCGAGASRGGDVSPFKIYHSYRWLNREGMGSNAPHCLFCPIGEGISRVGGAVSPQNGSRRPRQSLR